MTMAKPEREMSSFEKLILKKIEISRQRERREVGEVPQESVEIATGLLSRSGERKMLDEVTSSRPEFTVPQNIPNSPDRQDTFEQQAKTGAHTGPGELLKDARSSPERYHALERNVIQEPNPTPHQQPRSLAGRQGDSEQQDQIHGVKMPQDVAKDSLVHPERLGQLERSYAQRPKSIITKDLDMPPRPRRPHDQKKACPNSVVIEPISKQTNTSSNLRDGPSDKAEGKLSSGQEYQHLAELEDQIQIDEQIERDIMSHPKPPLLSGLKLSKRKRPKNDLLVDTYVDDRRKTKKPKTPTTNPDPEISTDDDTALSDSELQKGLRSPNQTLTSKTNVPFGPGRKGPRNKDRPKYIHQEVVDTRRKPSEWYLKAKTSDKYSRSDLEAMKYIKDLIKRCIDASSNKGDITRCTADLRSRLHDMEFYQFLSAGLIKKSKVLESEGLEKIFDSPEKSIFPWDIRADAEALWYRWMGGDFDPHLLRGIEVKKSTLASGDSRSSRKLDPTYTQRKSANAVGANGLMNGQWWPSRVCMLRDGAHGEIEAGIHGQTDRGAYSVVVAAGGYDDKDKGENIYYCGTESKDETPTKGTELLKQSRHKRQPLRVFRAVSKSKYAPEKGIRYDGLYDVIDWEILKPETAAHRFHLRRQSEQDPIRYAGVEKRPTNREIMEEKTISKLLA